MRIRSGLVATVLTCSVLLTGYKAETTSAHAVPGQSPDEEFSEMLTGAKEGSAARTLAPGHFRFTTGLDRAPQHIQGLVSCETRDDNRLIAIGDQDAGGVEIGLSEDESTLKYVDLGYRDGIFLMLVNDGEPPAAGSAPPVLQKAGATYLVSGYARGLTATQHDVDRYFEISVACP